MSDTGTRLELAEATAIAHAFIAAHCRKGRIEIVGSIRRQKPTVGDIELLLHRDTQLVDVDADHGAGGLFPSVGTYQWVKNGPKYGQLLHKARGYKIDLFRADDNNWGSQMVIRTGPWEFSQRYVAALRARGYPHGDVAQGYINDSKGNLVPCPDEATAFRLAGFIDIHPTQRF